MDRTFHFVTDGKAIWGSERPMTLNEWFELVGPEQKVKRKSIKPMKTRFEGWTGKGWDY